MEIEKNGEEASKNKLHEKKKQTEFTHNLKILQPHRRHCQITESSVITTVMAGTMH